MNNERLCDHTLFMRSILVICLLWALVPCRNKSLILHPLEQVAQWWLSWKLYYFFARAVWKCVYTDRCSSWLREVCCDSLFSPVYLERCISYSVCPLPQSHIAAGHACVCASCFRLWVLSVLFLDDLRSLVRFVSFWKKRAKSEQAKSNHLLAGSSICMCTPVS